MVPQGCYESALCLCPALKWTQHSIVVQKPFPFSPHFLKVLSVRHPHLLLHQVNWLQVPGRWLGKQDNWERKNCSRTPYLVLGRCPVDMVASSQALQRCPSLLLPYLPRNSLLWWGPGSLQPRTGLKCWSSVFAHQIWSSSGFLSRCTETKNSLRTWPFAGQPRAKLWMGPWRSILLL